MRPARGTGAPTPTVAATVKSWSELWQLNGAEQEIWDTPGFALVLSWLAPRSPPPRDSEIDLLTFPQSLLSSLLVEHSREMPTFGAFVRDQRPKPTSRRYLQYFLHRRAAFLAEWPLNALASLLTRHATLPLGVGCIRVYRVHTLGS